MIKPVGDGLPPPKRLLKYVEMMVLIFFTPINPIVPPMAIVRLFGTSKSSSAETVIKVREPHNTPSNSVYF